MALAAVLISVGPQVGCMVQLSEETPGAKKSCNQPESVIKAFVCGPYTQVIGGTPACQSCHTAGAAGGNAMSFTITSTACCSSGSCSDSPGHLSNYCTALSEGNKLVEYPQSDAHTADKQARLFTASEIQALIDWVNSNNN
jgi:hypothetical protein